MDTRPQHTTAAIAQLRRELLVWACQATPWTAGDTSPASDEAEGVAAEELGLQPGNELVAVIKASDAGGGDVAPDAAAWHEGRRVSRPTGVRA
ncbi:hypothetical protein ACQEVF_47620 [Nonomuraea polychroma]|uniref:hypothetical protein n=1 Tax=Nonomuraea polychroma TaxID=46176 RepID=UPI003D8E4C85